MQSPIRTSRTTTRVLVAVGAVASLGLAACSSGGGGFDTPAGGALHIEWGATKATAPFTVG